MSNRIDIQVLCPWCREDMSHWYVNDTDSMYEDHDLPSINEKVNCRACGNSVVVVGMTAPSITVACGRTKEEQQLEKLASIAKWKDQITALRRKYSGKPVPSLKCKCFGHTWERLAGSGNTSSLDVFRDKTFSLCKNCLTVLDTLHENPDDYGYWCK